MSRYYFFEIRDLPDESNIFHSPAYNRPEACKAAAELACLETHLTVTLFSHDGRIGHCYAQFYYENGKARYVRHR